MKTLTVHNFSGGTRTFAFSPDATDSAPGSNPTIEIPNATTISMPWNTGVRYWWYTPETGWQIGFPSDHPKVDFDLCLTIVAPGYIHTNYVGQDFSAAALVTVPVIGPVALPSWVKSPEAAVFFVGFCFAAGVRIFRAARRWFARASDSGES